MNNINSIEAEQFKRDPRIGEGKRLLIEALLNHQQQLTGIRPPKEELIQSYNDLLAQFHTIRGGKLYYPYIGSGLGRGPLVELLDGSVKYDMISGIGPHFWGHSHPGLTEVALDAALADTIMQGHLQQNRDAFILSDLLVKATRFDHCFLSSSGAMANENALKLAFHHQYPADRLLAFEHCFMGRTLALAQITDKPNFREGLPLQLSVDYVPFYRADCPEESTKHSIKVLKQHLHRYPKRHAAMCFELIQGEGGFNVGTREYFIALMDILKEHQVAIFVDEIQTFGRTTELFAFQHFDLSSYVDLVSIGKMSQVCATLFKSPFKPKPGLLSQTFTSSSIALAASCWIVEHLLSDHFFGPEGHLAKLHQRFEEHFNRIALSDPSLVQGPFGLGAMVAFTPLGGEHHCVDQFVQKLFHAGVIAFTAGSHPTRVRMLIPAGAMTLEDVDVVMQIIEETLRNQG